MPPTSTVSKVSNIKIPAEVSNLVSGKILTRALMEDIYRKIFPPKLELLPQVNESYELELAFYENRLLSDEEIIQNGAYFASVSSRFTRHFLMCSGEPVRLPDHSSSRLRAFFKTNQFKTGYATHGLFPYRGKFHPQMIKGVMNAIGLKPGHTVLDPMMGSGTVIIEATLMGINSVGVDASPFCGFMTQAKLDGLTVPLAPLKNALQESRSVFDYFGSLVGQPKQGSKMRFEGVTKDLFVDTRTARPVKAAGRNGRLPKGCESKKVRDFLLLAYLDSAGYSERSNRKSPFEQFQAILERYYFVAEKVQKVLAGTEEYFGKSRIEVGDAKSLPIPDASIDGIVFSPPYSFAIDYLENDSFHLGYLGIDIGELRQTMIGLRGKTLREKYELYKSDMDKVLSECARVLRPGCVCSIVVGTNNNQLSQALDIPKENVQGIDELMVELGNKYGMSKLRKISRQITGMANTMRTEYIVMLQRT